MEWPGGLNGVDGFGSNDEACTKARDGVKEEETYSHDMSLTAEMQLISSEPSCEDCGEKSLAYAGVWDAANAYPCPCNQVRANGVVRNFLLGPEDRREDALLTLFLFFSSLSDAEIILDGVVLHHEAQGTTDPASSCSSAKTHFSTHSSSAE